MPPSRLHLREWVTYRRFAVPAGTIEGATRRRLAGDWRGACAAAGVFTGHLPGRLPAPAAEDLRHLAPDLLRWHLPQRGYEAWEYYDGVAPLTRYPDGSALLIQQVYAPPPQRRLALSF